MINSSLSTHSFPSTSKTAQVTPKLKKKKNPLSSIAWSGVSCSCLRPSRERFYHWVVVEQPPSWPRLVEFQEWPPHRNGLVVFDRGTQNGPNSCSVFSSHWLCLTYQPHLIWSNTTSSSPISLAWTSLAAQFPGSTLTYLGILFGMSGGPPRTGAGGHGSLPYGQPCWGQATRVVFKPLLCR